MSSAMTARILDRIRTHYLTPTKVKNVQHVTDDAFLQGGVMLTEVASPDSGRRADAIVIGLTKSRGGIDGFEVKVDRRDWQRELDQPTKADGWYSRTHRWWVAAPSDKVVQPSELPPGWGLMVPSTRSTQRMTVVVKPETRTPDLSWPVVCELVKKLDRERASAVADALRELDQTVRDQAMAAARNELTHRRTDEERIGQALVDITGLQPWQLMYLDRIPPEAREVIRSVFTVATSSDRIDHTVIANTLGLLVDRHRTASEQYATALAAINQADGGGES